MKHLTRIRIAVRYCMAFALLVGLSACSGVGNEKEAPVASNAPMAAEAAKPGDAPDGKSATEKSGDKKSGKAEAAGKKPEGEMKESASGAKAPAEAAEGSAE